MTPEQIVALGPAFTTSLEQFEFCCDYTQTFHLLEVSCRGLLSDLPRKSAEPIALAAGTASVPCRSSSRTTAGATAAPAPPSRSTLP